MHRHINNPTQPVRKKYFIHKEVSALSRLQFGPFIIKKRSQPENAQNNCLEIS